MKACNERRVCVTGATGYIGSWLVRSLLQQGYHVHATARDPGTGYFLLHCLLVINLLQGNFKLENFESNRTRSEERRVGKECLQSSRSRWSPDQ